MDVILFSSRNMVRSSGRNAMHLHITHEKTNLTLGRNEKSTKSTKAPKMVKKAYVW